MIDQMDSGMTAMIISFADTPQVVQEFTDNRRLAARAAGDDSSPRVRGTDLHGALDLADGLANPGRITTEEGGAEIDVVEAQPATVYIFSDGRFEDVKGFSLGNLKPVYVPIGSFEAKNLAITAFTHAAQRSEAGRAAGVCAGGEFHGSAADGGRRNSARRRVSRCQGSRGAGRRIERRGVSAGRCAGGQAHRAVEI